MMRRRSLPLLVPRNDGARITASYRSELTVTAGLFRFSLNRRHQDRCSSQRVRRPIPCAPTGSGLSRASQLSDARTPLGMGFLPTADRVYGPMPGSNIGRTSDSPSKPGQYFLCNSMNSVAIRIASAFESVFRIAQPPMTSLLSENGPSVTVILPLPSRTRTPSLLGSRPPVSTRVPFLSDFSTNLPIASIKAGGGGDSRYDSEWRMNVRYFMAPPRGSDRATNEPGPDRHRPGGVRQGASQAERAADRAASTRLALSAGEP